MLALNNINYKASIIGTLIMLALNERTIGFFSPTDQVGKVSELNLQSFCL